MLAKSGGGTETQRAVFARVNATLAGDHVFGLDVLVGEVSVTGCATKLGIVVHVSQVALDCHAHLTAYGALMQFGPRAFAPRVHHFRLFARCLEAQIGVRVLAGRVDLQTA